MNLISQICLFLAAIGVLISDRWLNNNIPGFNASYLIFPFLLLSISNYTVSKGKVFIRLVLSYITVLLFFFIAGGAQGYVLLTTTMGTALIALAAYNMNFRVLFVKFFQPLYVFLTLLTALAYYAGMWQTRSLVSERLTFMNNNENIIAHQLCEGLAFCLYIAFAKAQKMKLFLLFIAFLFLIPISATYLGQE
ncbi:MAG: hypothetical protein IPN76_10345 [Saprospiraceae bacterium]|nr:hypothetical protein [Saprospiraceae bacterium]